MGQMPPGPGMTHKLISKKLCHMLYRAPEVLSALKQATYAKPSQKRAIQAVIKLIRRTDVRRTGWRPRESGDQAGP